MTKTEYRAYISSEAWLQRRKAFLIEYCECERCLLPRWLAVIAYDQDLHVHHRNYIRIGCELPEDLAALCKRCHELETFGKSSLHKPQTIKCPICFEPHFDLYADMCASCTDVQSYRAGQHSRNKWGSQ